MCLAVCPRESQWWIRALVRGLHLLLISATVLNDMRHVAMGPFKEQGVYESGLFGVIATLIPLLIVITVGGTPILKALAKHFIGTPHAIIRTINIVMCLLASALTRTKGDDDTGVIHSLWHVSTACLIAGAITITFDASRYFVETTATIVDIPEDLLSPKSIMYAGVQPGQTFVRLSPLSL